MNLIRLITLVTGSVLLLLTGWAIFISIYEREFRAATRLSLLSLLIIVLFFGTTLLQWPSIQYFQLSLLTLTYSIIILLLIPFQTSVQEDTKPGVRIDERDTMFARNDLVEGTEHFEDYYKRNPANLSPDENFRRLPGLLNKKSNQYHPLAFAAAEASFIAVSVFKNLIHDRSKSSPEPVDASEISRFIKQWAIKLGSVNSGITRLQPYHLYSFKGRKDSYGKRVLNDHTFAIAFLVEMDLRMIQSAPAASTVMESAQQYLASGAIAVQVAEMIRGIGYSATAHIDGNYEVICPLVARDAGLGEIGRMGLLMTPNLGPRVRIAVVTTDLPLIPDHRIPDSSINDFCRICRKCVTACPAKAIPDGNPGEINGVKRWQINQEACYTFWCRTGTDCGRCILACPFSHPDSLLHNLVRWAIRNSFIFRKFALVMDNFLYGKIPISHPLPDWIYDSGKSRKN